MGFTQSLFGTNRTVPQKNDRGWGGSVTGILQDLMTWADKSGTIAAGKALLKIETTDSTLAAAATLTPVTPCHHIQGSGGAVTLSATTAIADGAFDGQTLVLIGAHATNTVRIPDSANTDFNGDAILALGESMIVRWNATRSVWEEVSRSH